MNDKELKKSFNKAMNIEHLIVFLLVACLSFSMCFGFACHAENVEQTTGGTLGAMFNFDYPALSFSGWQNSIFNTGSFNTSYLPQMSGSASNYPLNIDTSDFSISPKQFIFVNRSGWSLGIGGYLVLVDNANVVAVTGNNCFGLASTDGSDFNIEIILYNNDGTISTAENPSQDSSSGGIYTFTASRRIDIMTSSMYIYGSKNNYNISDAVTNIVLADDPLTNGFQMNYLLFDENGELQYENPFVSGGGSLSEQVEKGLYLLKGSCVYLSNKSFDDGTLYVNALLSDSQKNNSNLQLRVKGSCTYSFAQTALSETRRHVYVSDYNNQDIFSILWPSADSGLSSHSKTVNCTYGLLGSQPFSLEYISDNKATTKTPLTQVNSNMFTSDIGGYGMSFGGANIHPIASAYDSVNNGHFNINNMTVGSDNIKVSVAYLDSANQNTNVYLTDVKYHFELYVVDVSDPNNIEWSDLIYSYDCDMLNGTSSVGTDGTLTYTDLNNIFDGDIPEEYLPSDTDSNFDVSGGSATSGNLYNYDNDTITIESNGEVAENIVNELIPSGDSGYGLAERIEDYTESNNFLALIKTTYSYVPQQVFDYMQFYFEVSLGILAVAFVLRIILDLL